MSGRNGSGEPRTITLVGLVDRFMEAERNMPDRSFAFVLGAGASRTSGIKGAADMVGDWVRSLHGEACGDDSDPSGWATAQTLDIAQYDPLDPAGSYSELYRRMYAYDPNRGYAYLEEQMKRAEPSFGYSVLARIMDTTRHKMVVTTNFDNLIADSLSIYSENYPLVCGHESLAGFISIRMRRPLVVKVHRDLLLAPKSTPEDLDGLPEPFREALKAIFREHTPIVIGYGGNDGSLMSFLKELPENSVPGGVYWCYWGEGPQPSEDIRQFVAAQRGVLVPIPGFDEAMMMLGNALEFELPEQIIEKRAAGRAKRIVEQAQKLRTRLESEKRRTAPAHSPDSADTTDHHAAHESLRNGAAPDMDKAEIDALNKAMSTIMQRRQGAPRWWQWEDKAATAETDDERDSIYRDAIAALPDSAELLGNYAIFLKNNRKSYDEAEARYIQALTIDPSDADYLGNYAVFLTDIRKDYDKADEYYIRALAADPAHTTTLSNYALFLKNIRKDYDKAEEYYVRALNADTRNARHLGNYAWFLESIRKDYDKAEEFYRRAFAADPNHGIMLGGYALFLETVRKDYDHAEAFYFRAIAAEPNHANNLGNFARLLLTIGRTEEGLAMLDRALAVPDADLSPALAVELRMYETCHRLPEQWRAALSKLKTLLLVDKITTGDWDFSGVIEAAKRRGHPAGEWLDRLAAVCAGTSDASVLDAWDAWKTA